MRTTLTVLVVLLVAQLAAAAALKWGSGDSSAAIRGPLLTFEADAVDAIRITNADGDTVKLKRTDDGWVVPAADGFPASHAKVERLLNNAHEFKHRLPVARSEASWQRFHVAGDKFERRVQFLIDGEPQATLLLGESAGAGSVYARVKGQRMLYEVDFALHYAAADAEDWLDHSVLNVAANKVRKIVLPEFTLKRADEQSGWKLVRSGGQSKTWAKKGEVDSWLRRLARPDFEAVAKAEPPKGNPAFSYTLITKNGDKTRFAYYRTEAKDEGPRLYRKGQPWAYKVNEPQLSKLEDLDAKQLVAKDKKAEKSKGEKSSKGSDKSDKGAPASTGKQAHGQTSGSESADDDKQSSSSKPAATAKEQAATAS